MRSDIFSFGVLLYEMIAGRRAFAGDTWADVASAIIKEDPPDLLAGRPRRIGPGGAALPGEGAGATLPVGPRPAVRGAGRRGRHQRVVSRRNTRSDSVTPRLAQAGDGGRARHGGRSCAGFAIGRRSREATPWFATRLTFRRGTVDNARFSAQGTSVVYSASWEGSPSRLFRTSLDSPVEEPLDKAGERVRLAAVSGRDELSLILDDDSGSTTLASMPTAGGIPKALLENVVAADWSPKDETLVVSIAEGGGLPQFGSGSGSRVRLLPGPDLVKAAPPTLATRVRFSPDGKRVAFITKALLMALATSARQTSPERPRL